MKKALAVFLVVVSVCVVVSPVMAKKFVQVGHIDSSTHVYYERCEQEINYCNYYTRINVPGLDPDNSIPIVHFQRKTLDNAIPEGYSWEESIGYQVVPGGIYLNIGYSYNGENFFEDQDYKILVIYESE